MKKIIPYLLLGLTLVAVIAITGCKQCNPPKPKDCKTDLIKRGCSNSFLVFPNLAEFKNTYDCLNTAYEKWNDDFETAHGALSDSAYNALADSLNFNEDQPLIDFENFYHFTSTRKYTDSLEQIWLDNNPLNPATDPDNNTVTDDVIMSTLLNQYGEVQIGDTLYKYLNPGMIIQLIAPINCDTLDAIRKDPDYAKHYKKAIVTVTFGNPDEDTCSAWKKTKDYADYKPGYKYRWAISIRNYLINVTVASRITSFKQKANGHWKKYKLSIYTSANEPTLRYNDCSEFTSVFASKGFKNRKTVYASWLFWDPHLYRTQKDETFGFYSITNGIGYPSPNQYLTW